MPTIAGCLRLAAPRRALEAAIGAAAAAQRETTRSEPDDTSYSFQQRASRRAAHPDDAAGRDLGAAAARLTRSLRQALRRDLHAADSQRASVGAAQQPRARQAGVHDRLRARRRRRGRSEPAARTAARAAFGDAARRAAAPRRSQAPAAVV